MLTKTILQLLLTVTSQPLTEFIDDCAKLFDQENYREVIQTCTSKKNDSEELQFMIVLSEFYMEIPQERLNFLFYNGSPMYELTRGEKLFKYNEKDILKTHLEKINKFSERGYPFAPARFKC